MRDMCACVRVAESIFVVYVYGILINKKEVLSKFLRN